MTLNNWKATYDSILLAVYRNEPKYHSMPFSVARSAIERDLCAQPLSEIAKRYRLQ